MKMEQHHKFHPQFRLWLVSLPSSSLSPSPPPSPHLPHLTGAECDMVLIARSIEGLQETKALVLANALGARVHLVQADIGEVDQLHSKFSEAVKFVEGRTYQQAVLVHNAATVGDIAKPIKDHANPQTVHDYMAANFTSVFVLTSLFLSCFKEGHRIIVNATSLLAKNYNFGCGFYSPGKAARNALMGVLAVENPDVRVLSYSPGVVDTDMLRYLGEKSYSETVREGVKGLYENKVLLTPQQAASKLVTLLREDKFENGSMVDYFDEVK